MTGKFEVFTDEKKDIIKVNKGLNEKKRDLLISKEIWRAMGFREERMEVLKKSVSPSTFSGKF